LVFYFIISRGFLTFVEAVILILKHATFLRLSGLSPKLALIKSEVDYREANINLNIREHLMASFEEHMVEQFAGFIMATDIGLCIYASVTKMISHQAVSAILVQHIGTQSAQLT
jgi:hypothetical protein